VTYRFLEKGEIVQEGDEVDACRDAMKDDPVWKPAVHSVGRPAPDPRFSSHRIFRRKVEAAAE
jgi:hypothetical protein